MNNNKQGGSSERRGFLKTVALSAPAAVAAAGAIASGQAQAAPLPDPTSNRLQDTAHTRAYYDSAKF
ncbi:MAG: hypothetical protein R3E83_07220 [Burkholderiaceae bacterium]